MGVEVAGVWEWKNLRRCGGCYQSVGVEHYIHVVRIEHLILWRCKLYQKSVEFSHEEEFAVHTWCVVKVE